MFSKILIANRGEIALRILRCCRDLGISTVAVYSTADRDLKHVRLADETVCIGPPSAKDSYLNFDCILSAAQLTGAEAIHPGYGFLAENADFAEAVELAGLCFIGPNSNTIRQMGDKISARRIAADHGIPCLPGSRDPLASFEEAKKIGGDIGYPIILKAAAGGGGRGMRIAHTEGDLKEAFEMAGSEAEASFGNADIYAEKYLESSRHIEFQILGDRHGSVIHLGERDCSVQRRHQKIVEEATAPGIDEETRLRLGGICSQMCREIGYFGPGTLEFLYADGQFYFIEMNTRVQVEHPVTEMITGIDIIREQIQIAANQPLQYLQEDIRFNGNALECRINAEDPTTFVPSPGTVSLFHPPGGPGVRVDSHLYSGYKVPPHYDSLIAKVIVHAPTRDMAIERMRGALAELYIDGIKTNIETLNNIISHDAFRSGDVSHVLNQ